MADYDVKLSGFAEIEASLLSLESGEVIDRIQRQALRAAGAVIRPALVAATPVRASRVHGKSLPAGALKAAVRERTSVPKDGAAASETVDFGKLSYIAHAVDVGHVNPTAKTGLQHTPAHPFIRAVEEETHEQALAAYLETMQAEVNAVLEGK